jgi:hypothetical protein
MLEAFLTEEEIYIVPNISISFSFFGGSRVSKML